MGLTISGLELKNGLRVVLVQDARATEVQVTMRYQVGANDDPAGQEGVAHLVEHLMYQQVLGGQSLFAKLESFATFFNGTTSPDATTYVERGRASHLEEMLSIEAVRVGFRCTSVTDAAFIRERAVVMNEVALRSAGSELLTAINEGLYPAGHPYRHRIGGTPASVGAITREQACAFADAHYAPHNAVLVVSGSITPKTLEGALGKFIAKVAKRPGVDPVPAPIITPTPEVVTVKGPVDTVRLLVAWALPRDLAARAKMVAIASLLQGAVAAEIAGNVSVHVFGDAHAAMLGLYITLGDDETIEQATKHVKDAVAQLPLLFRTLGRVDLGEAAFDRLRQQAIYGAYAALDDTLTRDAHLADYVLAGMEPAKAAGQVFEGLREMNRNDASVVSGELFRFDHAAVVVVQPRGDKKTGSEPTIAPAIHDMGQHRDPPDPVEATKPAPGEAPSATVAAMTTRVLPNGLKVVLLPLTSVPTVDIRLIFNAGTADERPERRGEAIVAGYGLTWDSRYFNDYLLFSAAGGSKTVTVGDDITVFTARGLDMHIDVLLAGLRRSVRDGRYLEGGATVRQALAYATKVRGDSGEITDAWATAVYGETHPYAHAGLARHASPDLQVDDAKAFRATHYTPDNATIVISGRFDGPLTDRWVEFLFGDWKGQASPRAAVRATPAVASLARDADTTQVGLVIALPARNGSRAQQLVAAAMLDEISTDIRHQLGASYMLGASLGEDRLATTYLVAGTIDTARTREAIELVRTRLDQLATEPDVAARAFVRARTRVLAHLSASEGTAGEIASRVETDVQLGRAPLSDLTTAAEVHQLTLSTMVSTLGDLSLANAAIQMIGPTTEVDAAFAAIGRTPRHIAPAPEAKKVAKVDDHADDSDRISLSDLVEPLTGQPPPTRLRLTIVPFALATGSVAGARVNGYGFAAGAELRIDRATSVGLHVSLSSLDGTKDLGDFAPEVHTIESLPITVCAALHSTAYDRLWGGVSFGFHGNRYRDNGDALWDAGVGLGLEAGIDLVRFGRHRLGLYTSATFDLFTTTETVQVSGGLAYRL